MPTKLTAVEMARKFASRELSVIEAVNAHFDRIDAIDDDLGCFLTLNREEAHTQALAAQARYDAGTAGPLTGVPIALKDNLSTMGLRTTCASKILENYIPPYDATVVSKLRAAGLVFLGKTNLDEFAMGTSTEFSAFQVTKNPWDTGRSPGGSSGGSAAAVSAQLATLSLGSDTGGSIRQPAALCGLVGFKPTYGRCSRYGLVAFGSSLDQIGPLTRTVADTVTLSSVITGHDPLDSTSLRERSISAVLSPLPLKGLKLGVPKETLSNLHPGVERCFNESLDLLRQQGAEVIVISLPAIEYGVTTYYLIAPAEASSNLARFDGIRFGPNLGGEGHIGQVERTRAMGFGHEVKSRIMIGTYALSAGYYDAFYLRAQQVRSAMTRSFNEALESVDLIISPTSPIPAFKLGELKDDPLALKVLDFCTIPANMGGFPALSLNCGFSDGLPVGLQILGRQMDDERVLQTALALEDVFGATPSPPLT